MLPRHPCGWFELRGIEWAVVALAWLGSAGLTAFGQPAPPDGIYTIVDGLGAGQVLVVNGGIVNAPGTVGGIQQDPFICPPADPIGQGVTGLFYAGTLNGQANPDPAGCGWGRVLLGDFTAFFQGPGADPANLLLNLTDHDARLGGHHFPPREGDGGAPSGGSALTGIFRYAVGVYQYQGGPPFAPGLWQWLTDAERRELEDLWRRHCQIIAAMNQADAAKKASEDCAKKLAELKARLDAAQAAAKQADQAAKDARAKADQFVKAATAAQRQADAYKADYNRGIEQVLPKWAAEFGVGSHEFNQAQKNVALQKEAADKWQKKADDLRGKAQEAQKEVQTATAAQTQAGTDLAAAQGEYDAQAQKCKKLAEAASNARQEAQKQAQENPGAKNPVPALQEASIAAGRRKADAEAEKKRQAEAQAQAAQEAQKKAEEEARRRAAAKDEADLRRYMEFIEHVRKHAGDDAAQQLLDPWGNSNQDALVALSEALAAGTKAWAGGSGSGGAVASSLAGSALTIGYAFLVNYAGSKITEAGQTMLLKQIARWGSWMIPNGQRSTLISGEGDQTQKTFIYRQPNGTLIAFHYSKSGGLVKAYLTPTEVVSHGGAIK